MNFIILNPKFYSEKQLANNFRKQLENQYLQIWDNISSNDKRLENLHYMKKNYYKESIYLKKQTNAEHCKIFTKLRLSCSKLNGHQFNSKNSNPFCNYCKDKVEDTEHFVLHCNNYQSIRENFKTDIINIYPDFNKFSNRQWLMSILSVKIPEEISMDTDVFKNKCTHYIYKLYCNRFKNN